MPKWGIFNASCSLMSMDTPLFYFKIEVIIWQIFSGQSLNKNLLSLLFQRNYLNQITGAIVYAWGGRTQFSRALLLMQFSARTRIARNKHAVDRAIISFTQHLHYLCDFSLIELNVSMALVFYYKDMLEKVTMQRTQQFLHVAFSFLPKEKAENCWALYLF